jgi:large conductance mechanosensitive channel
MLREFRQFILRGNLVDLAVAVVVGTAFTALVNSLVKSIFTPLIAAIFGKPAFSNLVFTINGSRFLYGEFINALITFLTVAAVMFFVVVKPVNALLDRLRPEPALDKPTRECPECLSSIPAQAKRCAFCTTELAAAA